MRICSGVTAPMFPLFTHYGMYLISVCDVSVAVRADGSASGTVGFATSVRRFVLLHSSHTSVGVCYPFTDNDVDRARR